MKTVAVFFGGKSPEHDISIITGLLTFRNLNRFLYKKEVIYISKENKFYAGKDLENIDAYVGVAPESDPKNKNIFEVFLLPGSNTLYRLKRKRIKPYIQIDAAVLATHGEMGENGTLVGALELSCIPTSAGSLFAKALSMDKVKSKIFFQHLGLSVAKHEIVTEETNLEDIEIEFPAVVKPCSLGSSIGVRVVKDFDELTLAVQSVLLMDNVCLVEEFIDGRELNCACFKNAQGELVVSECEEPIKEKTLLSFKDKYLDEGGEGMASADRIFPAIIPKKIEEQIKDATKRIYELFGFRGIVRVDYFYKEKDDEILPNEVNAIPGSLAHHLFKNTHTFGQLLSECIDATCAEHKQNKELIKVFNSTVLENYKSSCKKSRK
ncbi:MAG: ATP-grasp domain-containing protein [Firmicutes bacterium]|nr:ATP-grasp domain-containing protein [Bacillota bacterium]